jgi:hypothetical protein
LKAAFLICSRRPPLTNLAGLTPQCNKQRPTRSKRHQRMGVRSQEVAAMGSPTSGIGKSGNLTATARTVGRDARGARAIARATEVAPIVAEIQAAGVTSIREVFQQRPVVAHGKRRRCAACSRGSSSPPQRNRSSIPVVAWPTTPETAAFPQQAGHRPSRVDIVHVRGSGFHITGVTSRGAPVAEHTQPSAVYRHASRSG